MRNNDSWQSYLIWLSERGLAYPMVSSSPAQVEVLAERRLRLLAISASALAAEERTLLGKMIAAMGLTPEQIMLCDGGSVSQDHPVPEGTSAELILVLGPESGRLFDLDPASWASLTGRILADERASLGLLLITHPSDLIRQPQGKRQAWIDLQLGMRSLGLLLHS